MTGLGARQQLGLGGSRPGLEPEMVRMAVGESCRGSSEAWWGMLGR